VEFARARARERENRSRCFVCGYCRIVLPLFKFTENAEAGVSFSETVPGHSGLTEGEGKRQTRSHE